jgi:hypothetical protein
VDYVTRTGEIRNAYGISTGKVEEKRPLRIVDIDVNNIQVDVKETGCEDEK